NKFSSPQPDREHPYGHQKFEALGALGIAAFLGIVCFEIIQSVIDRVIEGAGVLKVSQLELWILLIVLGINIFVAFTERAVGKRIGSAILIADAKHTMSDVWITITVIAGLIGIWLGYQWLDIVLALPVAMLVFWSGWSVVKENLPWLVDEIAIAPEVIHKIALSVPGVINCHDIASRGVVGSQVFIEMHLIVDAKDVETAHRITEEVEHLIEEQFSPVRVVIHVEPRAYQVDSITFGDKNKKL
ncbi:MAG: cation diffusion facilitator family transporter, partial [Cyanobacteria bacterium P01_A01_bin.84]